MQAFKQVRELLWGQFDSSALYMGNECRLHKQVKKIGKYKINEQNTNGSKDQCPPQISNDRIAEIVNSVCSRL